MTYTINVLGKGGKPVRNKPVAVRFPKLLGLDSDWEKGEADDDGTVTFSSGQKPGQTVTIYVDGYDHGKKTLKDDGNYTIHHHH